jgi:DNA-binding MarR family transcriptional regulator
MAKTSEPQTPDSEAHLKFELSDHLPFLFKHIHSQLDVASGGHLAKFGVSVAVWRILAVLWAHDNLSHRELAQLTSIEVSTLSRVSKTVQRDGLIRRKRTMEDQRTVRVTLTAKGRELAQKIIPEAVKAQDEMFGSIPPEDIRTLTRLLHAVVENLNRYTEADLDIESDPPAKPESKSRVRGAVPARKIAKPAPAPRRRAGSPQTA